MLHAIASHVDKLRYILGENSSTILSGVGVAGTIATAVLTAKSTFKAAELIEQQEKALREEKPLLIGTEFVKLSTGDKVKLVWPQYLPPVAVSSVTIGCIITANRISSKKVAAMAAAVGISERAYSEYKEKVIEKLGARQDEKIRDEVAQDRVTAHPVGSQVIIAGTGEVLCYDITTGRYFQSTVEEIKRAENKVNYELIHYDSCSLSTFYDEIGLEATPYTDSVGWNVDNHMEVKFSTVMSSDNRPCLAIDFSKAPISDYDKARWR